MYLVHRLVLEAFVGPCPPGMECRHFPDRDPTNNRLDNLSWATRKQNMEDKASHGTNRKGVPNHKNAGCSSSQARFTDPVVIRQIRAEYVPGLVSYKTLGIKWRCRPETISNIVNRRTYASVM